MRTAVGGNTPGRDVYLVGSVPMASAQEVCLGLVHYTDGVEEGYKASGGRQEVSLEVHYCDRMWIGSALSAGPVSHATNVVEHPEVVADRTLAYVQTVGRENVIAGTDCGLGGPTSWHDS
jgi:hypothetical protein